MRLSVTREPSLPPVAGCLRMRRDDANLLCGASVAVGDGGFVQDVRAADAHSFGFASSAGVFGMGGRIEGDDLIAFPPSHPSERTQYLGRGGESLVSGSLAHRAAVRNYARAQRLPVRTRLSCVLESSRTHLGPLPTPWTIEYSTRRYQGAIELTGGAVGPSHRGGVDHAD